MQNFHKVDLLIARTKQSGATNLYTSKKEKREIGALVGETAYFLYDTYKTQPFKEAAEIEDDAVAHDLGWPVSKVRRYRNVLEQHNLFKKVKGKIKDEPIVKMLVGAETIALYNAGLPEGLPENKTFIKLKRTFKIETTEDLLENIELITSELKRNPDAYR